MGIFRDRHAAGRVLAASLAPWRGTDAVVAGIPRGGVVVAAAVAAQLGLPLTAVAVRKLGSPAREEFAVGAIAAGVRVIDAAAVRAEGITPDQLAAVEARERAELARRAGLFTGTVGVRERTVVVVDDGIATGATALAACRALRAAGASRLVLAVPVAPGTWHPDPGVVDEYVCPHPQRNLRSVGRCYDDFAQTDDAEVLALLTRHR